MHLTPIILALLPSLTLAADPAQKPLQEKAKGWLDRAKGYIPTAVPTVPGLTAVSRVHNPKPTLKSPIKDSANAVAAKAVHPIGRSNWHNLFAPPNNGEISWMIFVTGGNRTCSGHCHNLHVSWNETAAILSADPIAPKLGLLDCDNEKVLCATWRAQPPTIWHVRRPAPGQAIDGGEKGESEVRINYLNYTTTGVQEMVALHTGNKYRDGYLYGGYFQPFDGELAKYGILEAVGWVLFVVGLIPSWSIMLTISMVTRLLM